jgi:hypothetical protein
MARLMPDRLPLRPLLAGRGTTIAVGVAVLVGIPLAAAAGYIWLRDSSAFAVRDVQVRGADVALASQLRTATLDAVSGRSLLAVSSTALQRDLERLPPGDLASPFYLRLEVEDRAGVLARIAQELAAQSVSVAQLVQQPGDGHAVLHVVTHEAASGHVDAALAAIRALPESRGDASALPVVSGRGVEELGWA